ncbi:MAG: helix-hairpin-helix domain-containing protein [Myxococcota bacterium]|nr:helix-hairpin-helix domain-containing protein [Myxococcota bacterium]
MSPGLPTLELDLDLDADDLEALFEPDDLEPIEEEFDALKSLTRAISSQYSETIASFVRLSFQGEELGMLEDQMRAALASLGRLAHGTGDGELSDALVSLEALVPEARIRGGQRRERYLREMRTWVLDFARLLGAVEGKRLLDLVRYDERSRPLLHRLEEVYGIGPRRLERLYLAGLLSVETLMDADPAEVAQVTGMSPRLVRSLIYAAQRFDKRRRMESARQLLDRCRDVVAIADALNENGQVAPDLLHAMLTARMELDAALTRLDPKETA